MSNCCAAKRVVIVSSVPISEPVIRNRLVPFFNSLLESGYKVSFVCPRSEIGKGQVESRVELYEVPINFVKPKDFVGRAVREVYDVLQLMRCARKIKADAWLVTIPSMFLAFLAPYCLSNRKVFLDVRDLTWEYLSDETFLQRISKNIFRSFFKRSLRFFKLVYATNPTEVNYIESVWRGGRAPLLISNGITRDQFEKLKGLESHRGDTTTISYIGNVGLAQKLDTFIEAAEQLPDVQFRVVGSGIDFDRIERIVREKKLKNVLLTGRVSWDVVWSYYNSTDVLYAQLTPDFSGAMPSKLYEYLATGKRIIYGGCGQAVETLSAFENNQVVQPGDVTALVKAIKLYGDDKGGGGVSQGNRSKINSEYIREDAARQLVESISVELNEGCGI